MNLLQANEIIKKLQGDLKTLMGKLKLKNTVTIQQEKLLAEKEEKLQKEHKELQDVGQSLRVKEQEVVSVLCFLNFLFENCNVFFSGVSF